MKKIFTAFTALLVAAVFLSISASAFEELPDLSADFPIEETYYVIDRASLLSDGEILSLESELESISISHAIDVIVLTVDSLEGKTATEYADDFFDYGGYGQGENRDGVILLVSMEERDWAISTSGCATDEITDAGNEYISDSFLPYLSDGQYFNAFETFAEKADELFTSADNGEIYDDYYDNGYGYENRINIPKEYKILVSIIIGLITGTIAACIVVKFHFSKLTTVYHKSKADEYLAAGSFAITQSDDRFLRSNVVRVPKPQATTNRTGGFGGGSSTHVSSSGSFHGGSSGKF